MERKSYVVRAKESLENGFFCLDNRNHWFGACPVYHNGCCYICYYRCYYTRPSVTAFHPAPTALRLLGELGVSLGRSVRVRPDKALPLHPMTSSTGHVHMSWRHGC